MCYIKGCADPGTDESMVNGETVLMCLTCRRAFVMGRNRDRTESPTQQTND